MILFLQNAHIFWTVWSVLFASFFLYILYLVKKRKRYHSQPTEFEPPENINPLLAGYLIDGEFHVRDYIAGFTYLVQQDIITINKEKPKKNEFTLKDLTRAQAHIEKIAFSEGYIEKGLSFHKASALYGTMFIIIIIGFLFYLGQITIWARDLSFLNGSYIFLGSLPFFIYLMYKILYLSKLKLTEKGHKAKNSLIGFKNFLNYAESHRIEYFNNLKNNKDSFTKYLPYAIALNVESQWKNKYSSLIVDIPAIYTLQHINLPRLPYGSGDLIGFIDMVQEHRMKK